VSRYSRRQLIFAKCALVGLFALIAGPHLADGPGDLGISIITVLALVGGAVAAYEALSRALAFLLGRVWHGAVSPTVAATTDDDPVPPEHPPRTGFQVRHVLAVFAVYLATGAIVWFAVAIFVTARVGLGAGEKAIAAGLKALLPVALPASVASGSLAILLALRGWGRRLGAKAVADMIGLRGGTRRQLWVGVLAGTALGVVSVMLVTHVPYRPTSPDLIDEIVASAGAGRWAWIISAVILAPPVEEFMFRGVLLGGLARTWSLRGAVLVSGLTFWSLHATEWLRYWPAAVAIGLMTVIVTVLRLRTRALGPAIAAHSAYNLMMAVAVGGISSEGSPAPGPEGPKWAQACPLSVDGSCISQGAGYSISDVTRRGGVDDRAFIDARASEATSAGPLQPSRDRL
jgi:membrane protease YdiL (CAAX protease family)